MIVVAFIALTAIKNQSPFIISFLGISVGALIFSFFISRKMVVSVRLRRNVPIRAWQNQTVHIGYYLRNTSRRISCLGLHIEELVPEGIESVAGYCVHLSGGGSFRAGGRFVVNRRGCVKFGTVKVSTIFPFGLIEASEIITSPATLTIWPARGTLKKRMLHHGAVEISRAAPSRATGGQDEFFGLREYRPGDNPRWIHWRRSAAKSQLVIRELSRPLPEILWILLDTSLEDLSDVGYLSREKAIRFAGTLIDHAFAKGYQVGMALAYKDEVKIHMADAGLGKRCELLDSLANIDGNTNLGIPRTISAMWRGLLEQAQTVMITPNIKQLNDVNLTPIKAASRYFSVVSDANMEAFFDDNPFIQENA